MPDPAPPAPLEPSAYDATRREGRVVESTGAWVHVDVAGEIVAARVRGRLRLGGGANTNPVAVGDRVMLTREDLDEAGRARALVDRDARHWVYRRAGLPCHVCGTAVQVEDMATRKLYWCPVCQV